MYGKSNDVEKRGHIVRVTLEELCQHDNTLIDEAHTGQWLNRIYSDEAVYNEWIDEYQRMKTQADQILSGLAAFDSDRMTASEFEKLFDGVEVLPQHYEADYVQAITEGRYLDASSYFVNISSRMYKILAQKGHILPCVAMENEHSKTPWMVKRPYSPTTGLNLDLKDGLPAED